MYGEARNVRRIVEKYGLAMKRTAKITGKGQITVPKKVRLELGVDAGDRIILEKRGKEFRMLPKRAENPFARFRGSGILDVEPGRYALVRAVRERAVDQICGRKQGRSRSRRVIWMSRTGFPMKINSTNPFWRIGLWFVCLLLAVTIFSVFFGSGFLVVFQVTMMFALPVAVFYLPVVVTLKDAERVWTILISGLMIGPLVSVLWGIILQLRGGNPHMVWIGDGIDWGVVPCMAPAAAVGVVTTALYIAGLKSISHNSLGHEAQSEPGIL
jgi:AbrB family looped-hinge helix DNA binding protein